MRSWKRTLVALLPIIATIFVAACFGGAQPRGSARAQLASSDIIGAQGPDLLASMGWIGIACLVAAALFAMNAKMMQAAMAFATGIAFAFASSFLRRYGTVVVLVGVAAAAWFIASNWGSFREQARAWLAARKLQREGKDAEATALRRQAFPLLDAHMRRLSRKRKRERKRVVSSSRPRGEQSS